MSIKDKHFKPRVYPWGERNLYAYRGFPVSNEIKPESLKDVTHNIDVDPLTKDLCSPKAMEIALTSLEDEN